jgi:hypothetical protein
MYHLLLLSGTPHSALTTYIFSHNSQNKRRLNSVVFWVVMQHMLVLQPTFRDYVLIQSSRVKMSKKPREDARNTDGFQGYKFQRLDIWVLNNRKVNLTRNITSDDTEQCATYTGVSISCDSCHDSK